MESSRFRTAYSVFYEGGTHSCHMEIELSQHGVRCYRCGVMKLARQFHFLFVTWAILTNIYSQYDTSLPPPPLLPPAPIAFLSSCSNTFSHFFQLSRYSIIFSSLCKNSPWTSIHTKEGRSPTLAGRSMFLLVQPF